MSALELLLDKLDASREQILINIAGLSDDELQQNNVYGSWSVADIVANLTAWEAELVTGLMRIKQGRRPDKLLGALKKSEDFDQKRYQENVGRDLDRIFDDWIQVRVQLEDRVQDFSERDLTNRGSYRWLNKRSLENLITAVTIEREKKYLPALRAFAVSQEALQEDAAMTSIPLTTIEITPNGE